MAAEAEGCIRLFCTDGTIQVCSVSCGFGGFTLQTIFFLRLFLLTIG